jgi:hypothetical protein
MYGGGCYGTTFLFSKKDCEEMYLYYRVQVLNKELHQQLFIAYSNDFFNFLFFINNMILRNLIFFINLYV